MATLARHSAPPRAYRVSGWGQEMSDEGVKRAVSRKARPSCQRGDSGTAEFAAPKDSTTHAANNGPVRCHCSPPAVRYEGKRGADSAHISHPENGPSMKGLNINVPVWYFSSAASKRVPEGCIQLQGAVGGDWEGFRQNQADFNFSHIPV